MDLTRYNVALEIQELVLVDLPVRNGPALKQTIVRELIRLIETQGIPSALLGPAAGKFTQQANVDTGQITVFGNSPLGVEIAQSIYRGLGG